MKENKELQSGKHMLTSADSNARSEIFLLRERLETSEGENGELRGVLDAEKIRGRELEGEVGRLGGWLARS